MLEKHFREKHQLHCVASILQTYIYKRTGIQLILARRRGEGPSVKTVTRFHRSPARFVAKARLRWKARYERVVLGGAYNMECSVLVRIMKVVQPRKPEPSPLILVVPSVERLEVNECAPVSQAQALDAPIPLRTEVGLLSADWELRRSLNLSRNLSSVSPDVQFIREMIQRRPTVEQKLSEEERPTGVDGG